MGQKRKSGWIIALAVAVCIVVAAWYVIWPILKPSSDSPPDRVIFITLDTLRADHMSLYGYFWETTPFLDSLARDGVFFRNGVVVMPTTAPSHATIFTSLYPIQHGVLRNGHVLADSYVTLAERYQALGYRTAGIVSTVGHFRAGNMDQGFDHFDVPELASYERGEYRRAEDTIDAALAWFKTVPDDQKIFLWVHLFDPHGPFNPSEEALRISLEAHRDPAADRFLVDEHHVDMTVFGEEAIMKKYITNYDAEIHYMDKELRRFHESVHAEPDDAKTIWVVVTDHGQGVGTHSWWPHGKAMYNEQLRGPIIFWGSDGVPRGKVVNHLVEGIDLYPSLLDLVDAPGGHERPIEGQSLLTLIWTDREGQYTKRAGFSERRRFDGKPDRANQPAQLVNYEEGETFALQTVTHKYIYRTEGDDAFYDLAHDPLESRNLLGQGDPYEVTLRTALLDKLERLRADAQTNILEVDEEAMDQLKSLGYTR